MKAQPVPGGMKAILVAVIAIVIALAALGLALTSHQTSAASPSKREFYLITPEESFNETAAGITHYVFSPTQIVANVGDDVLIHFYNTADDTHHTLTLSAYGISVDLAPGEHKDVEFTASKAGIFEYYCTFHPFSMRGQLTVLSP